MSAVRSSTRSATPSARALASVGIGVAGLVDAAPQVDADGPAAGAEPLCGRQQHRTVAAAHVEHLAVAAQGELVQHVRPGAELAAPRRVQVGRGGAEEVPGQQRPHRGAVPAPAGHLNRLPVRA
jgi:hypothetical protein